MILGTNGIYNNTINSLYPGMMQTQMQTATQTQTQTPNQNSKNQSTVAKTGKKLAEMVLAIKQSKALNTQTKVQNLFQRLSTKIQNPAF